MNFTAATALLVTPPGVHLPSSNGVKVHAALMHKISDVNLPLGQVLHDLQRNKCITMALLPRPDGGSQLRLTFMGSQGLAYAQSLITSLSKQKTIRIGKVLCDIDEVVVGGTPLTGVSSWFDLMSGPIGRVLHFQFLAPTAIMKKDSNGERYTSLFPDTRDVFAGLARRWIALAGPELPLDLLEFIEDGGCVVANHELRTLEWRLPERTQIGFVGHTVYFCRIQSPTHVAALNALTRFAFFAGVGYQTARGMGATIASVGE
jgi:CRISPR-associated endoribonuclease Cas6